MIHIKLKKNISLCSSYVTELVIPLLVTFLWTSLCLFSFTVCMCFKLHIFSNTLHHSHNTCFQSTYTIKDTFFCVKIDTNLFRFHI